MFAYKADVIKNQKFDIGRTINPFKCDCEKCDFLHCPKDNYAVKTKPHKYKVSEFCEMWHDELIKNDYFKATDDMLIDLIGDCISFPKGTYWAIGYNIWNKDIEGVEIFKMNRKNEPVTIGKVHLSNWTPISHIEEYDFSEAQYKLAKRIEKAFIKVTEYIEKHYKGE